MTTLTANPWILDMICYCVGGAAMLIGLLFLWRALFADRANGRRRCPKCWYDMAGVPGLRCPECGREAAGEARMSRTRRRWRAGGTWAMVVLLGIAGTLTPRVSRLGPMGVVPSSVLVWCLPGTRAPGGLSSYPFELQSQFRILGMKDEPLMQRLAGEAWRRAVAGEMWEWQSRALVERWQKKPIEKLVKVPSRWRVDRPVPIKFDGSRLGLTFSYKATLLDDGAQRRGDMSFILHERGELMPETAHASPRRLRILKPVTFNTVCGPIHIRDFDLAVDAFEPGAVLEGLDDQETTAIVKAALDPRLVVDPEGKDILIDNRSGSKTWARVDFAITGRLRVMLDGKAVGTGTAPTNWDAQWMHFSQVQMTWEPGGLEALLATPAKGSISVTGIKNPEMEEAYLKGPFDKRPAEWTGTFEIPLRVDHSPRTREK